MDMKNNIIKLKKDKRSKIEKGDLVAISKTGKAQKAKKTTRNFENVNIDGIIKMELTISNKFDSAITTPEAIVKGKKFISFETECEDKFLDDFLDFLESKIIKKMKKEKFKIEPRFKKSKGKVKLISIGLVKKNK